MSRIRVVNHLTLDGVMQAPGRPDEDTRDGFAHGGWAAPGQRRGDGPRDRRGHGQRRRARCCSGAAPTRTCTAYWPHQTDNPFTDVLNNSQKYVASTTLREPLPWENSTLLEGDAADAVAALKEQRGRGHRRARQRRAAAVADARATSSTSTCCSIHPLVLGIGPAAVRRRRHARRRFELVDSVDRPRRACHRDLPAGRRSTDEAVPAQRLSSPTGRPAAARVDLERIMRDIDALQRGDEGRRRVGLRRRAARAEHRDRRARPATARC